MTIDIPDDVLNIISQYSKPLTRPDWRLGCYYNRRFMEEWFFRMSGFKQIIYDNRHSRPYYLYDLDINQIIQWSAFNTTVIYD